MIVYLLTSSLLSVCCLLLYLGWIRKHASPIRRKYFLWIGTAASLFIPFVLLTWQSPTTAPVSYWHDLAFAAPVSDAQIQQYCQCASPDYSHRLLYRTHALYNLLLSHRNWIGYLTLAAIGFVLLKSLIQLAYLQYIVSHSQTSSLVVDDRELILLSPQKPLSVGAFWLGKAYIIWQAGLDELSEQARTAIFRHECSHIRQGNTAEKLGMNLLQCLWWFNPAFYYLRRELNLLSEYIADEAALEGWGDKKAYAHLLLRLATADSLPIVSSFNKGSLESRIRQVLTPQQPHRNSFMGILLALLLLEIGLAFPTTAGISGGLQELETYQHLIFTQPQTVDAIIFCPDCETICFPQ